MQEQFLKSWQNMLDRLMEWFNIAMTNLPNLVMAIIAFSVSLWLSRNIQKWLSTPLSKLIKQTSIHSLISNIVAAIIVAFGIMLALGILNLDTVLKSILAGAGVVGLAIGLALQGTLANTFSGVFLSLKDVINIGDFIETNGYQGIVESITLRNTTIRESDNNVVVIPNDDVLSNPFKNYGLSPRTKTTIKCRLPYNMDLRKTKQLIIQALQEKFPQQENEYIEFQYLSFDKSAIKFQFRLWVDAINKTALLENNSEAIMVLKEIFDQNQINIPLPTKNIKIQNSNNSSLKENTFREIQHSNI